MSNPEHGPDSICGTELRACQCPKTGPVIRTPVQRAALHAAAVARARRSMGGPPRLRILTEEQRRDTYVRFTERQGTRGAA